MNFVNIYDSQIILTNIQRLKVKRIPPCHKKISEYIFEIHAYVCAHSSNQ